MYRILAAHKASSDRRRRRHGPKRTHGVPRLKATAPNQVWAWDVSLLASDTKGRYWYLYAVIDVFSRKIVGWMIADCESQENAKKLLRETCHRQAIPRKQLTIHADRGSIMRAHKVSDVFIRFGVTRSHSRPRVSNDNAFIESFFKTTKYRHDYPLQFHSLRSARRWMRSFVDWYNNSHHHSGIAYFHPSNVHDGSWAEAHRARQAVMDKAYETHPERFHKRPIVAEPPTEVFINKPDVDKGDSHATTENSGPGAEEVTAA
jgi:putative transposase